MALVFGFALTAIKTNSAGTRPPDGSVSKVKARFHRIMKPVDRIAFPGTIVNYTPTIKLWVGEILSYKILLYKIKYFM